MLEARQIYAGYEGTEVLFGADVSVRPGECVALLGRNGMGKSTLVKVIMGMLKPTDGRISFKGKDISSERSFRICRAGIGLVPEGRLIAPNLTVRENLIATMIARPGAAWNVEAIFKLFPNLAERQSNMGNEISGGEQQLLAIGRALLTNPDLLVLDEATEGLAPLMRDEVWGCIAHLRSLGQAILIIDKNVDILSDLADRIYVMERGRMVWSGSSADFRAERNALDPYLGVG